MKIPAKIKVGGLWFDVKQVPSDEVDDDYGTASSSKQTIKLNKELPQDVKELTFLHEILHCINGEMEEKEVEFIAFGLFQVLKDNKLI